MTTPLTKYLFSDLTRAVAVKALTRSQIASGLLMFRENFLIPSRSVGPIPCICFQVPGDSQDKNAKS